MLKYEFDTKPNQIIEQERFLSCDWQIYIKCKNCNWEERFDIVYGNPNESFNTTCKKCGHSDKNIVRHLFHLEYLCQECNNFDEVDFLLNLSDLKCRKCSSSQLTLISFRIFPEFPKCFGEAIALYADSDWGTSGSKDAQIIYQQLQYASTLPDFALHFLPYIKFSERLRLFSYHDQDKDLGELWNVEGNLLRDYFRHTKEISMGFDSIFAFEKSVEFIEEKINIALTEHNIAMACYSLISKIDGLGLKQFSRDDIRNKALHYAHSALKTFKTISKSEIKNISLQVARIHYLLGDILKIPPFTDKDLKDSIKYFDFALKEKSMPSNLIMGIKEGKALALKRISKFNAVSEKEIIKGLKEVVRFDDKNRTYSEKLTSLLNLADIYLSSGKIKKAKRELEHATALGLHEIERSQDVYTLEHKVKEYEPAFNRLFKIYVKLNYPLKALCVLEQIKAVTLNSQIDKKKQFITKDKAERNILNTFRFSEKLSFSG